MSDADPASVTAMVEAAPLDIREQVAATMTEHGEGWLGTQLASRAARLGVAAWASAVNGNGSALTAIAEPEAAHLLLHPVRKNWVIAPDPVVTRIEISGLWTAAGRSRLRVKWRFTGHQWPAGPAAPPGWLGYSGEHVGTLEMALAGSPPVDPGAWPWRVTSGHVDTLDGYLGYKFTSRDETVAEFRSRTGSAVSAGALVLSDAYQLRAGFAEHDARFAGSATMDVDSEPPPTRDEATELAWPAIWAETERALGPGEWWPSLSSLEMVRLLKQAPAVEPAAQGGELGGGRHRSFGLTDADRTGLDAFARRYARSRGLTYQEAGWIPPGGPWLLATITQERSHGFLHGALARGPAGTLWYAERMAGDAQGAAAQAWTVAHYIIGGLPGASLACVASSGGRLRGRRLSPAGVPPAGLRPVAVGNRQLNRRYKVGVADGPYGDRTLAGKVFTAEFTAWLGEQPYGKPGRDATYFELRECRLCVYARGAPRTAEDLDAFCERAARIAAQVTAATNS